MHTHPSAGMTVAKEQYAKWGVGHFWVFVGCLWCHKGVKLCQGTQKTAKTRNLHTTQRHIGIFQHDITNTSWEQSVRLNRSIQDKQCQLLLIYTSHNVVFLLIFFSRYRYPLDHFTSMLSYAIKTTCNRILCTWVGKSCKETIGVPKTIYSQSYWDLPRDGYPCHHGIYYFKIAYSMPHSHNTQSANVNYGNT